MSAHTSGPWRFEKSDGVRKIMTPNSDPNSVLESEGSLMCDERFYPWVPEADADWHLIAAGPEMLAALEAAEWSGTFEGEAGWCPLCRGLNAPGHGHERDCLIGNAISKAKHSDD